MGMDADSIICLSMGVVAALAGRMMTVLDLHPHWQCRVALHIKNKLEQSEVYTPKLFSMLSELEGIRGCNRCKAEPVRTVQYISCVPIELYLSHKLKKRCRFALLLTLLLMSVLLPFCLFVTEPQAVQVILALLMFSCFPMVAIGLLLVCIPFLSGTKDEVFFSLLGCWLLLFMACLSNAWYTERKDEKTYVKKCYMDKLEEMGLEREDSDICLAVLHRKLTHDEKTRANELTGRISG